MMNAAEVMNYEPMTNGQVVRWWELRRVPYNALLLVIGISALLGYEAIMSKAIPFGEDAIEPMALLLFVPLYGLIANLCYTMGWLIELAGRNADPVAARRRGRWMFRIGMWFSCALTTLPFWYACVSWAFFNERRH
jgi:hypothetical protein